MDVKPEELQSLGFHGIYRESYNIILSRRKIFSQITISLILPLSFIFLGQLQISELLFPNIVNSEDTNEKTEPRTRVYNIIHDRISLEWTTFWIFKAIYLMFLLIFSLLSTRAVVYTIACIYTSKEINLKKVISFVPIVWKRLMITLFWNFFIMFVYNLLTILFITLVALTIGDYGNGATFKTFLLVVSIFYFIGFVYISVVWHLASAISVLEESYGLKALKRSKQLIKGKMWIAFGIFIKLQILFFVINIAYENLVVHNEWLGTAGKTIFGSFCFLFLSILIHFALVTQTIVYFVCKSYHHEKIEKSCFDEHLEVYYLGDYIPLIDKDVQLQELDV